MTVMDNTSQTDITSKNMTLDYLYAFLSNDSEDISLSMIPYMGNRQIWKTYDLTDYIKIFAYIVIITGGFFGNIGVISTVAFNKSMWTTIHFYMANLAIADAMICIFCMIPNVINTMTEDIYILGAFMCKFHIFMQIVCLICSVLTLAAMSCDRYMAVKFQLNARFTKNHISAVIASIWIFSIIVSVPLLIVKKHIIIEWKDFQERKCAEQWPVNNYIDKATGKNVNGVPLRVTYYMIIITTLYILPVLIMIFTNSVSLIKLWVSQIPGERNAANENNRSQVKKQWALLVFFVLVTFIICWTPLQALLLYGLFRRSSVDQSVNDGAALPTWFQEFTWFSYYIAFANSFFNPIIYGGFDKKIRNSFYLFLTCNYARTRREGSDRSWITSTSGFISSLRRRLTTTSSITGKSSSKKSTSERGLCHPVASGNISPKKEPCDLFKTENV